MTRSVARQLQAKALTLANLAGPVPSPCVSVCKMDAQSNLCTGCYRTLDEIMAWSRCDDVFKTQVWHAIEQRVQKDL